MPTPTGLPLPAAIRLGRSDAQEPREQLAGRHIQMLRARPCSQYATRPRFQLPAVQQHNPPNHNQSMCSVRRSASCANCGTISDIKDGLRSQGSMGKQCDSTRPSSARAMFYTGPRSGALSRSASPGPGNYRHELAFGAYHCPSWRTCARMPCAQPQLPASQRCLSRHVQKKGAQERSYLSSFPPRS